MSGISSGGGTGAAAIETAYVEAYRAGLAQQFQQFDSRLLPFVEIERQGEEFVYYDRIGIAEDMKEDNTRVGDNPVSYISHDRRRIGLKDYENGMYIEQKDLYRILEDPTNAYVMALKASGHRKLDDIILDRIFGPAYTGKKGQTVVNFVGTNAGKITVGAISKGHSRPIATAGRYSLTAGDYEGIDVAVDYVDTGTPTASGITLAKLKAARFTMQRLEAVTQDEVLDCFITSSQAEQLLGIEEIINSDYAIRKALAEGNVTTVLGFRFIQCERLRGSGTSGDPRQCIISRKSSFKLAVAKELEMNMWRDTSKKNIPYIYFKLCADGTRMWGETTLRLNCLD